MLQIQIFGFVSKKTNTDGDDFIQITIPPGAYEIESLNNEIKRIFIEEEHSTELTYSFHIKANFSKLGSIIDIQPQEPIVRLVFEDSTGKLLGFHETILYKNYNQSKNPVDILSYDNIFIRTNIAQGLIFRGKRSGIIHYFTTDVDPGYKYIEKFIGGVQWYMMESKDFISSNNFKLKMQMEI